MSINRHRAGSPIGGQFAPSANHAPPASLTLLAGYDPAERASATADLESATAASRAAARKAMTFEVANVAQIAYENQFSRSDKLVIAAEADTDAAYVTGIVVAADQDDDQAADIPGWWSEDLADFKATDLKESLGFAEPAGDYLEVEIGAALDAEDKLLGGPGWTSGRYAMSDRRGKARQEVNDQRDKAAHAAAHLTMLDVLDAYPHAKAARFVYDDKWDVLVLDEILDQEGLSVDDDEDVVDFINSYDNPHLSNYTDTEAINFTAEDLENSRVAYQDYGQGVVVPFDVVRRLRGVADDPNQPSLFEHDHPANYGWDGRAAA